MSDSRSIQHWHGATDIHASRGQLPKTCPQLWGARPHQSLAVKNADQEPGAIHQKERRAASKGWLSQVLTCLPGCGPVGALRNLLWKWFSLLGYVSSSEKTQQNT